jgi:ribosomal protein L9
VLQMNATAAGTTGTARVAWDKDKLYYLFEMKDTTPFAMSENEKNDSVEVWVDELNTKNGAQTKGDYQMRVDLNNAKTTSMSIPPANLLNSVTSAVYLTQTGYQVEIAVPYTTVEHAPKVGDIIGFNASANDDTNGDGLRDGFVSWVDPNLAYWADTRVYNDVKLAAPVPLAAYGKPVLDGVIDSFWENATTLQMDTIATGTTGKVRVAWDETALYYLFEMKDTTPYAVAENEKNDSVEVWVDELNTKNGAQTIGDYQMRVDLNNAKTTSMKVTDILNKATSAVARVDGGYVVELEVQNTKLVGAPGEIIGFNATANDDSNGDGLRNGFVTWVDRNLPYWADTRVYNRIQLAKGEGDSTPSPILVTGITVTGAENATNVLAGSTLQMSASILPVDAANKLVTWRVTPGTGTASISSVGLLTATTAGTVSVTADAQDGSTVSGSVEIAITAPISRLSIVDFGAIANDGLDDLPAIKLAVAAAKTQGKSVYVPSGEFTFNGLLTLDAVDLSGDGETSILKSINLTQQSVVLTGDGTDLSAVKLTSVPATVRLTNDDSARVRVGSNATNYSIKNIVIDGGSSVGFYNAGTHGVISGNTVQNMLADGIHITALSNDILVENNTVHQVGDDFIAVVSYEKFGGWVKNVVIRNNNVSHGEARGLTVSGGENVLIENNTVSDVYGAGIYLSSEGNYKTYTVKDVIVRNNTVTNDSINGGSPTKGGLNITATNKNPSIDNVLVENNTFIDSQDNGALIVGTFEIDGLQIKNNVFQNPANYGIMIVKTVFGEISITGNTVTSSGKAVYVNNSTDPDITSDLTNEAENGGGGGTHVAAYGTPTIDGQADDFWAYATVLQMNTSAAGTTGTARVAWDEDKLYYLFEMQDATPFAVSEKEKNDSVEIWMDELNSKHGAQSTGDYQMRVDLNNAKTTSMKTSVSNFLNSVTSAVYRTQTGYQVEIAVPFTTAEHAPKVGDIVGFNASANDDANGDGMRDGFVSWVDPSLPYWADTRVYNEVKLAAPVPLAAYGKPVLDGVIDSFWDNATTLQMDTIAAGTTGKIRVAWDETALYYLFEMKDSTPYAVAEKEKNDSVEVWVDELNTKNGAQTIGDYQMRVDLNNAKTTSMKVADILNNVTSAVYKGTGGYNVEIAVKYTKLIPSAGEIIGFNATANDDSNGDGLRNGFVTWVDRNLPYWADTRVYNRIQLAKPKAVQTPTP